MFIESSYPQLENQKARLLTPAIYSDKQCLEFYYHMWGNGKAVLNILTKSESGQLSLPIWSRNKNYGNKWNLGQVTIPAPSSLTSNQKYQIAFEGVIGNSSLSFQGDIAIDDIKIENRACPPIGFCDFESKQIFCSWSNIEGNDDFDWEEGGKDTGLLGLGPAVDHTYGNQNGHYIFIGTFFDFKLIN